MCYVCLEGSWHRHMTRVDLAIDYYNTVRVEPLVKVTRKKSEVWYQP